MSRASYLDAILTDVGRRLDERKARVPLGELRRATGPVARSSFADALRTPQVSLIAEVKRCSPSKGPIRPGLDVAAVAAAYEAGGAAAISVLTETDHFGGNLADLRTAAAATSLPVLRKDFIVDPYQVYEARAEGASALLLIAAILDDAALTSLAALASEQGLDVLLEVHDAGEMARALAVEGALIGVNNRDLHTFDVSLGTTMELAPMVPVGRLLVAESGIRDHDDVERLARVGVDAVLVGESLLRSEDLATAVLALASPVPVKPRHLDGGPEMEEVT